MTVGRHVSSYNNVKPYTLYRYNKYYIILLYKDTVRRLCKLHNAIMKASSGFHDRQGGYSARAPPLTIPNREVKPCRADGTATAGE